MSTTRREFLAGAGKLVLAAPLVLPVLQACLPTSAPVAPQTNNSVPLSADGSAVDVSDLSASNPLKIPNALTGPDGFGVLVTYDAAANPPYHALTQRCTHQSCAVDSRLSGSDIHCSCHGSTFALNGDVLSGPATTNLPEYTTSFDPAAKVLKIFPTSHS